MPRLTAALAALLAPLAALAAPTQLVHHGRLLDSADRPVSDTVTMTFSIHEKEKFLASEPDPVAWTGTYTVQVEGGAFSVVLGGAGASGAPQPLDTSAFPPGAPRWLSVKIGSTSLEPRLRIGSVPYAAHAEVARSLQGGPVSASAIAIGTKAVVDANGEWVGATGTLDARYAQESELTSLLDDRYAQTAALPSILDERYAQTAALPSILDDRYAQAAGLAAEGGPQVHWKNLAAVPPGLADGDQDTTYRAGDGLALANGEFKVDASVSRTSHHHDGTYAKPADLAAFVKLDGTNVPATGLPNLVAEKGPTRPACSATANVGRIFFDTTSKLMLACDGTGWTTMNRDWQRVAYDDLGAGIGGWTGVTTGSWCGSDFLLGGYNVAAGVAAQKPYSLGGVPHNELRVRLKYYALDSWDGEEAFVELDGQKVFSQATTSGAVQRCGHGAFSDRVIIVDAVRRHSSDTVVLRVGSTLDQAPSDESWGLADVELYVR